MRYLVAYDVSDDGRRTRVANILMDLGDRMQYSVFEVDLEPRELEEMLHAVGKVLDSGADNLRVYRLCANCRSEVRNLGRTLDHSTPERWIL